MSALPYLKFYCADWRADPRLRMCSLAARGLWIDLMTYMHEGKPYGHLTIDGAQPDLAGISALVARPVREVKAALAELEARNIFSRSEGGAIYSRRMVRDKAKAERDRANGKGGGNPNLKDEVKAPVKGGVNPPDKAQIPDTRDQIPELIKPAGAGGGRYAFEGLVVKLNHKNFDEWEKSFKNIDLRAELIARDAWLASPRAKDSDRESWFISTSKYLVNRNAEARKTANSPRLEGIV